MRVVLDISKCLALLAFAGFCVAVTLDEHAVSKHVSRLLMSSTDTVESATTQLPLITQDANTVASAVATTTQAANGAIGDARAYMPALASQVELDLEEGHRLILEAGLTATEARKASAEERAALPALTASAQASIDSLNREMVTLQSVTSHADALVSDPNLRATIAHVESTTGHLDGTAADVQQEVHSLTHPTWLHKMWGGMLDIAHVFNPL